MKRIAMIVVPFVLLGAVTLVAMVLWYFNIQNQAMALHERYNSSQKVIQTAHDNMWKVIKGKAKLTDDFKNGFIKSIDAVVVGRTGGALIKSVQENMPGLPDGMYKEVLATIEGKRDMLKREMDTSVDIAREFNTYIKTKPRSYFLSETPIDAHIITSSQTEEAYQTGKDDNF